MGGERSRAGKKMGRDPRSASRVPRDPTRDPVMHNMKRGGEAGAQGRFGAESSFASTGLKGPI